jgi:hypothetical protein
MGAFVDAGTPTPQHTARVCCMQPQLRAASNTASNHACTTKATAHTQLQAACSKSMPSSRHSIAMACSATPKRTACCHRHCHAAPPSHSWAPTAPVCSRSLRLPGLNIAKGTSGAISAPCTPSLSCFVRTLLTPVPFLPCQDRRSWHCIAGRPSPATPAAGRATHKGHSTDTSPGG